MPDSTIWRESIRLTAGAFLLALAGCASLVPQTMELRESWPEGVASRTEIGEVPFFPQEEYQCGPAALATALVHAGAPVTPDELVNLVYLPARQGSLQIEMLAASRRHSRISYPLSPRFDHLLREVAAGNPVIVLQDTGFGPLTNWHYAVVVGFDYPSGELYLRSGATKRLAIPFTVFEFTWRKSDYWAMVTMPPDRVAATATESGYLAAISAMERVGDPGAAKIAYAAALNRWPESVAASVGLANRDYALGLLVEAELVLRRAAARQPNSVAVLNNLAQVLSDLGKNDEALVFIERAAQPAGSAFAAAVRETHALILKRMGRNR